jgi:hypothetical protein
MAKFGMEIKKAKDGEIALVVTSGAGKEAVIPVSSAVSGLAKTARKLVVAWAEHLLGGKKSAKVGKADEEQPAKPKTKDANGKEE